MKKCDEVRVRDLLKPGPDVQAYLPIFFKALTDQPSPKAGLAAVMAVWQYVTGSITVPVVVAFSFFWLDFASGIIRAIRDPGDEPRWERAGDGLLKMFLYAIMYMVAALVEVLITETPPYAEPNGVLVASACGFIIAMELTSIRHNIVAGMPEASRFFDRLFSALKRS